MKSILIILLFSTSHTGFSQILDNVDIPEHTDPHRAIGIAVIKAA